MNWKSKHGILKGARFFPGGRGHDLVKRINSQIDKGKFSLLKEDLDRE